MGEKPLSIDEAPVQTATVGGVAPGGGFDAPPPDLSGANQINTTRSNIKHSAARAGDVGVSGAAAGPVKPGPTSPGAPGPTDPGDPFPPERGAELEASGKRGWYRPSATDAEPDAAGVAAEGEPIPGLDVKLGRNPGSGAAGVGPVKPEPTRPADPTPTHGGPTGMAIKEQGIKYGEAGGEATPAGDTAGVADAGQPIPGVDIIIKKNPPR
jgi:hypothetical protein